MRAVIQRVSSGKVTVGQGQGGLDRVGERCVAEIGLGLVILLGIGPGDSEAQARALVDKIAHLRIFEDDQEKMNLSVKDVGGAAIVVSQFTLYADVRRGRRPSFTDAALPAAARPLVDTFAGLLAAQGVPTQTGEFGAHMRVEIANDGPVTIVLDTQTL